MKCIELPHFFNCGGLNLGRNLRIFSHFFLLFSKTNKLKKTIENKKLASKHIGEYGEENEDSDDIFNNEEMENPTYDGAARFPMPDQRGTHGAKL